MFNSKLELVNNKKPNILNYVHNLDSQKDYQEDLQNIKILLKNLNSLNKIFVKVNKYIYKKAVEKVFNMENICNNYNKYLKSFDPFKIKRVNVKQ